MEILAKNVLCFVVLVFLPSVRGEECDQSEFMQCAANFMQFFSNVGASGADLSDPDAIMNIICGDEGKEAFGCMLKSMTDCPDLMNMGDSGGMGPMAALENIPGFDMKTFMKSGGMDGACALMTGPCSKVKDCYKVMPNTMAKRGAVDPASINYYMMFHTQSSMMCGAMKDQMTCMLDALDHCPQSVVDQVEAEFENALKMSMSDEYGVVSYQDTKKFIQEECPKMPQDFSEDMCTKGVLLSQNFTQCNANVSMKYTKNKNCAVHALSKDCIMDNIEPKCGDKMAMFFARNTHMIFPGIPNDCEGMTAGSDTRQISFGTLLFSSLMALVYLW